VVQALVILLIGQAMASMDASILAVASPSLKTSLDASGGQLQLIVAMYALAFGTLGRRKPIERVKYAAWSFAMFVLVGIALGWLMYPFSR